MIFIILILGLILRLIGINQSFWLDEAITATIARDLSAQEIINKYLPLDNSPPFYVLLINFTFAIFPGSEFVSRMLSVLFGLGTIFFIFKIAQELKKGKFALITALFLATSPLHVYYSQEGRMYALTAFLATIIIWSTLKYLDTVKVNYLISYTIAGILLLYTHYLPNLILIVSNILVFHFKKLTKGWMIAQITIALSFIFIFPIFSKQLKLGIAGRGISETFDKVLGKFDPKTIPLAFEKFVLGRIPVENDWTLLLIIPPLFLFLFLLCWGFYKSDKKTKKVLGVWLFIPVILATIISIKIPVFLYYRVLFILPAFYLLISLGTGSFKGKVKVFLVSLIILINLSCLFLYYSNPSLQREQWKQSITWIHQVIKPEGEIILFAGADPWAPYLWYAPNDPLARGGFEGFYVQNSDQEKVRSLLTGKQKIFLYTYLQDITDPQKYLQKWIKENKFVKIYGEQSFIGVGEIEIYER